MNNFKSDHEIEKSEEFFGGHGNQNIDHPESKISDHTPEEINIEKAAGRYWLHVNEIDHDLQAINAFIDGAKSKEAKEYHCKNLIATDWNAILIKYKSIPLNKRPLLEDFLRQNYFSPVSKTQDK